MSLFAGIEAALHAMPDTSLADMERARREAGNAPPPTPPLLPMPDLVHRGRWRTVFRYPCPHACGWYYERDPATEPYDFRLVLPANHTPDDVSAALTARANAQADSAADRVRQAIAGHLELEQNQAIDAHVEQQHPDRPTQGTDHV